MHVRSMRELLTREHVQCFGSNKLVICLSSKSRDYNLKEQFRHLFFPLCVCMCALNVFFYVFVESIFILAAN